MMQKPPTLSREDAESIAISALSYLAGDMDRLGRFLALTGIDPSHVREAASDPAFLGSVLDHLLADESLLFAFASSIEIDPVHISAARRKLDQNGPETGEL